jgi:hypothetical protein
MIRIIAMIAVFSTVALAGEHGLYNVLGWTGDGASLVYKSSDDTGIEAEFGYSGQANLAVVVDGASGAMKQYLLDLSDATAAEKKRYHALASKKEFEAWLKEHPTDCKTGRQSPDGKSRAEVSVQGKVFAGSWKRGRYLIESKNDADDFPTEAFKASFRILRDGKAWVDESFEGHMAFYGGAIGSEVALCWSPDGARVAWILHTGKTMRDPEYNEIHVSGDGTSFDPEVSRTAALHARKINASGMRAYRGKKLAHAMKLFREAIAADGEFVTAHYNLACVAALQGDKATALAELKWLSKSADPDAKVKLAKAATDPDLRSLADDPDAKAYLGGAH